MEGLWFGVACFFLGQVEGEKNTKSMRLMHFYYRWPFFLGRGGGMNKKHMWLFPKQMIGDNWVEKIRELNHLVLQLET